MFTTAQQRADRRANVPIFLALILLGAVVGLVVWVVLLPHDLAAASIPRVLWGYLTNDRWRELINESHILAPLWLCVAVPAAVMPFMVAGAAKHFQKGD